MASHKHRIIETRPRPVAKLAKHAAPDWAKRAAAPAFRRYGRLTAAHRLLPGFLIIGAKRGGTTTMLKYLQQHPGVHPMWPAIQNSKKTWYFDDHFDRSPQWYRSFFTTQQASDRAARSLGYRPITGEAAPYYLYHPLVPARVAETIPGVRLIVLLRNPVDRTYSHWNERRNAGVEPLEFQSALEAEAERTAGQTQLLVDGFIRRSDPHDHYSYLDRSDYLPQLQRWHDVISPDQMLVLRSEDLYLNPGEVLDTVHRFLQLPPVPPAALLHYNRLAPAPLDPAARTELAAHFQPRIAALETYLGRNLGWNLDREAAGSRHAAKAQR